MHDALARCQPLHIARAETGGGSERVRVVDTTLAHDGHRFKTPMRMRRKAGHGVAVVHAPAVLAAKVLAQIAACERGLRAHHLIARRVGVVVVHAKQKGINGLPGKAQGLVAENGAVGHGALQKIGQA